MLDTNVFNHVQDGQIELEQFAGHELFTTHVQHDELMRTRCPDKKAKLLSVFQKIELKIIPTNTFVADDSRIDQAKCSISGGLYETLLNRIQELDKKTGKKKLEINQSRDARIAETAIKEGLTLVTNDQNLTQAAQENGCHVVDGIIKGK